MDIYQASEHVFVGRRLVSAQLRETLLPKRLALLAFASDVLSSVAYVPDGTLITLSLAGVTGYLFSWQIGFVVGVVIVVMAVSYQQTVRTYPTGGGDYEVAASNLGRRTGLTVASALLVDYVLTVAVLVSVSVLSTKAMLPGIDGCEVSIAVGVIVVLILMNLRGVRDSGEVPARSTYVFMFLMLLMFTIGFLRTLVPGCLLKNETSDLTVIDVQGADQAFRWVLVAVITRVSSSDCAALTGVEAVANGMPSFRPPRSRNAASVFGLLGLIAATMLVRTTPLVDPTRTHPIDELTGTHYLRPDGSAIHAVAATVTGQLARTVFGDWFVPGFYVVITTTLSILFLAANVASNGFPSLASIPVRDGYPSRQLHTYGDRLAYPNRIVLLAVVAVTLIQGFNTSMMALIQLYVVGVFISFTVGQTGMVLYWGRVLRVEKDRGERQRMQRPRVVNPLGTGIAAVVLVVVPTSKFTHGAYLALVTIGLMCLLMVLTRRHYDQVGDELALYPESDWALPSRVRTAVLMQQVNLLTAKAIAYAEVGYATSLMGVTASVDDEEARKLMEAWRREDFDIPLRVIASSYQGVIQPSIHYVAEMYTENPRGVVATYVPDHVVGGWQERLLRNQTTLLIRTRLHYTSGVMVISVPYQPSSSRRRKARQGTR